MSPLVDAAVVAAFQTWKFSPAKKDGAPVKVRLTRSHLFIGLEPGPPKGQLSPR